MIKKLTVTIGIPAYNEEYNIKNLLKNLLDQKEINIKIEKVIVVCDKSNDNTFKEVQSIKNKKICVIKNKKRRGQIYAQNRIFSLANTDIVVLLEADTIPKFNDYIEKLIKPFFSNSDLGLIQGFMYPMKAKTIVEGAIKRQYELYSKTILLSANKNPIPSGRGGRAFAKIVYKHLKWPYSVPEDEYAFLWCQQKKIGTLLNKYAICLFRLPQNRNDYLREVEKNRAATEKIANYFPKSLNKMIYNISVQDKVKMFLTFIVTSPLDCFVYMYLFLYGKFNFKTQIFSDYWPTTMSTKRILEK